MQKILSAGRGFVSDPAGKVYSALLFSLADGERGRCLYHILAIGLLDLEL